jgi:hypothetical protein
VPLSPPFHPRSARWIFHFNCNASDSLIPPLQPLSTSYSFFVSYRYNCSRRRYAPLFNLTTLPNLFQTIQSAHTRVNSRSALSLSRCTSPCTGIPQ